MRSTTEVRRDILQAAGASGATFSSRVVDTEGQGQKTLQVQATAIGGSPSATLIIEGSIDYNPDDGTGNFVSIPYTTNLSGTVASSNLTVTTVSVVLYYLEALKFVRYIRVRCTANNNVTLGPVVMMSRY